jgi:hypothetical protein
LGVGAGQREKKGAGGEEETGRMVRMDSHHLKLYSEYWTTLLRDGEGRGLGWWVVRERRKSRFLHFATLRSK